jgi:ATP-dependent Clp endopeptidase proteolytic subunit ClpP
MPNEFYKITNKSGDTLEIDIEGPIGGVEIDWASWSITAGPTKESVKKLIKDVANSAASNIIVNINSYGGDVNDGISIHDMLAEHKAKVTTIVHGHTASAATIISQAGNVRKMSDNALFLIHPASTVAIGNAVDIAAAQSDLLKVDTTIAGIYAKRTGKTAEEITAIMNRLDGRGEWLTASEAKDLGFIDEIFEPMKAVASADPKALSMFGLPQMPSNKLKIENMNADKKTVFDWFKEFTAKITGKPVAEETPGEETPETVTEPDTQNIDKDNPEGITVADTVKTVVIADMEEVKNVLNDLTTQNETLTNSLKVATDELARLKGLPTETLAKEDPFLDKSNLKTNEEAHEANAAALRAGR